MPSSDQARSERLARLVAGIAECTARIAALESSSSSAQHRRGSAGSMAPPAFLPASMHWLRFGGCAGAAAGSRCTSPVPPVHPGSEATAAPAPAPPAAAEPGQLVGEAESESQAVKLRKLDSCAAEIRNLKQSGASKDTISEAIALLNALKAECQPAVTARLAAVEGQLLASAAAAASSGATEQSALQAEAKRLLNLLPSAAKKTAEKKMRQTQKSRAAAERRQFDRTLFTDTGAETSFLRHFMLQNEYLPRQARDKHRKSDKTETRFLTVRTQRKIQHLLAHEGSGESFVYHRRLADGSTYTGAFFYYRQH